LIGLGRAVKAMLELFVKIQSNGEPILSEITVWLCQQPSLCFNGVRILSSEIARLARRYHAVVTDPIVTKYDLMRRRTRMAVRSLEVLSGPGN
jgi:hypothetical protein